MFYGIVIAIGVMVVFFSFGYFNDKDLRSTFALSSLAGGSVFGVSAGFLISRVIGLAVLSIVFLMFAFLFGYERG
jgi:hypothetical protein